MSWKTGMYNFAMGMLNKFASINIYFKNLSLRR